MQEMPLLNSQGGARTPSIFGWIGYAKYLSILLSLLATAYVGHSTQWFFGFAKFFGSDKQRGSQREITICASKPALHGWEVQFPSARSLQRSGIATVLLEPRAIQERVKANGIVTYDERKSARLSARVSGTVWRIVMQPGDAIRRGDVLVIIEAVEVGRAKAEYFSDFVAFESKSEILKSLENVAVAVSQRQIRDARVAVREAKIRLQNSEQTLINLGLGLDREKFAKLNDDERATELQFLGIPASITKDLDPDCVTSNLIPLTASFDGVVVKYDAVLGDAVAAGKPLIDIADLRKMWLMLDVSKEDSSKLKLGQKIRFQPDCLQEEFESTINWISTEMNEKTRTLRARAEIDNPLISSESSTEHEVRKLRANTFGTGTIELRELTSAFVVPISAILHDDGQPLIFVKVGDLSFARLDVKLGVRNTEYIQVESDRLVPGMEIVSRNGHILKSEWIMNHVASTTP